MLHRPHDDTCLLDVEGVEIGEVAPHHNGEVVPHPDIIPAGIVIGDVYGVGIDLEPDRSD